MSVKYSLSRYLPFCITILIIFAIGSNFIFCSEENTKKENTENMSLTITTMALLLTAGATIVYAILTYKILNKQEKIAQKERIQNFVDFVIVPLIEKVNRNIFFLEEERFKWNYGNIRNINIIVDPEEFSFDSQGTRFDVKRLMIYRDFIEEHKIALKVHEYDDKIGKLEKEVTFFAEKIRFLPNLEDIVSEMLEEYKECVEKACKNDFEPTDDNIQCILRYIVDNREELEKDDPYHDFWNKYRNQLLEFREEKKVEYYKAKIEKKRKELYDLSNQIFEYLIELSKKYAKEYGTTPTINTGYI